MQTGMMRLVGAIVLLAVLFGWAPAALAYRAPYADGDVTVTTENVPGTSFVRVRHTIHDPVSNQDVTAVSQAYETIDSGPWVQSGFVCVKARVSDQKCFYTSVYDPALAEWVTDISDANDIYQYEVGDGVVALGLFKIFDFYNFKFQAKTYDPGQGGWRIYTKESIFHLIPIIQGGIAAYKRTFPFFLGIPYTDIGMAVYDPRDAAWHEHVDTANMGDLTVWVEDFLVKYLDNGGTEVKWVYDPLTFSWVKNPTTDIPLPWPWFVAQPTTGPAPLTVWFTDMSIQSSSVTWEFGDGGGTSNRSPRHTYNSGGTFNAQQKVTTGNRTGTSGQTVTVQQVATPDGSIRINGAAAYTNSTAVTLHFSLTFDVPGAKFRLSAIDPEAMNNMPTEWSQWYSWRNWMPYSLSAGDGTKKVLVQFKDAEDNIFAEASDSIILDTTPPGVSLSINGTSGESSYTNNAVVYLYLWASDYNGTGVQQMRFGNMVQDPVTHQWSVPVWSSWANYSWIKPSWTLSPGNGIKRVAVEIRDYAGNINITQAYATIILDTSLPSQFGVSINGGAGITTSPNVTLNVGVSSPEPGLQMRFINGDYYHAPEPDDSYWSAWEPLAPGKSWVLDGGDERGNCVVWSQLKTALGQLSELRGAQITLDNVPPYDGVLTAIGGDKKVTLNWSGFNDETSRITAFRLYCTTKPVSSSFSLIYQTLDSSFTHQNLKPGTTYYYKVVAVDQAGNVSAGAMAQAKTKGGALPFLQLLLGD